MNQIRDSPGDNEESTNLLRSEDEHDNELVPKETIGDVETAVYKKRWWMLFVYCFTATAQGMIWNTWAPLTGAAVIGFQWTEGQITALQALSGLVYIVAAFPILYVIEKYGKFKSCILFISQKLYLNIYIY